MKRQYIGFGFDPGESAHHFVVRIPDEEKAPVIVEEHFEWMGEKDDPSQKKPIIKIKLDQYRWERIAETARNMFNKRIRLAGQRSMTWKVKDDNVLAPHFGKELVLLAWALEDIDESLIPNVIANWTGLEPEERWWLYTTVNATFTSAEAGGDRGWRKAIKIAFSENPVPDNMTGERFVEEPERINLPKIVEESVVACGSAAKKKKKKPKNAVGQGNIFNNL